MVSSAASDPDGPWDLLVDLGRILPGRPSPGGWVEHADTVVVVLRSDAAWVLQIRDASPTLLAGCLERTGLVVVPTGGYPSSEIQRFTGLPVIGEIPYDPAAAAIATDGHGSRRRLSRSSLVSSAFRLGSNLIGPVTQRRSSDDCPDQSSRLGSEPPSDGNPQKIRAARRVWNALGRVPDTGTSRLSETFSEKMPTKKCRDERHHGLCDT